MSRILATFLWCMLATVAGRAQDSTGHKPYRIEVTMSGCAQFTAYKVYEDYPKATATDNRFFGGTGSLRVMWHPDHLLAVGLASGYILFSQEQLKPGKNSNLAANVDVQLTGIPLQLALAMRKHGLEAGIGMGVVFLASTFDFKRERMLTSSDFTVGMSAWASYAFRISDRVRIGPEILMNVLSARGVLSLGAGLRVQWDFYTY